MDSFELEFLILNVLLPANKSTLCPNKLPTQIGGMVEPSDRTLLSLLKDSNTKFLRRSTCEQRALSPFYLTLGWDNFASFRVNG
jgi:hypothetical protein